MAGRQVTPSRKCPRCGLRMVLPEELARLPDVDADVWLRAGLKVHEELEHGPRKGS